MYIVVILLTIFGGSHEILKRESSLAETFFENYRSNMPVTFLVDLTREAHEDAEKFIKTMNEQNLNTVMVEFFLRKFNESGITEVLSTNVRNKLIFEKYLKYEMTSSSIGEEMANGTALFYSILNAAYSLPLNSGILIFTDRSAADEDLAHLALQEVRRKRIRIYVAWGGLSPTLNDKESVVREAALYSNGAFLVNKDRKFSEKYQRFYPETMDAKKTKPIVLFKKNITGQKTLKFPIDSHVTGLHISLTSSIQSAALMSPNGLVINLLNETEIESFSYGSFFINQTYLRTYEIQLALQRQKTTALVGIWRLYLKSNYEFNVTISAQTDLQSETIISDFEEGGITRKKLAVKLFGDVREISKVRLLDSKGEICEDRVLFSTNIKKKAEIIEETEDIETNNKDNVINIDNDNVPDGPFYVEVTGNDADGNEFRRLSYYNNNNYKFTLPSLTVEVGLGSDLLPSPNQYAKIFFEITNNRDQTVFVRFRCHDDRSLLVGMQPLYSWMNPRQTVIVTVTARTQASNLEYRDLITFTASGADVIEKTAMMNVNNNKIQDYYEPYLTHRYTSDCMNVLLGNCEGGTWTIEVTAQDTDSGILQLTSNPVGLYFPNGYTAGTTEKITGYYSGSCCQPKLQLTATDRLNNRRSYTADAYYSSLSPGTIAAIVLGVLLLIIIIIALIILCRMKCRCCKQRESVDLPTYRGPTTSSRRY